MQTSVQLPPLNFPPLAPFLGGVGPYAPRPTTVSPPHPFVRLAISTTAGLVPRQGHSNHRHVHHHHQSPPLSSPAGSPGLNESTVASQSTPRLAPFQRSLPPLRPLLSSTTVGGSPVLFAFPAPPMPALPCWSSLSLPTSPPSSPPQSSMSGERRLQMGMKRKHGMSVPPTGEQRGLQARPTQKQQHHVESEVTFANLAQVAKWKLNGPRYKRYKVTDSNGEGQWKKCQHCGTNSTPGWRNGPLGKGTLCNACGLRYRSKQRGQTSRGQSGNVPVSLLLNPEPNKKGRTNVNHPMIWETKPAAPEQPQQHTM